MTIENQSFATFTYTLFENSTEGKVIEDVTKENPMAVVFGQGKLIPFFEQRLYGKTTGDEFNLHWDGEQKVTMDTITDLSMALGVALLLIFFMMVVYYKSFSLATTIVLASFISVAGVIYMHLVK